MNLSSGSPQAVKSKAYRETLQRDSVLRLADRALQDLFYALVAFNSFYKSFINQTSDEDLVKAADLKFYYSVLMTKHAAYRELKWLWDIDENEIIEANRKYVDQTIRLCSIVDMAFLPDDPTNSFHDVSQKNAEEIKTFLDTIRDKTQVELKRLDVALNEMRKGGNPLIA